MASAVSLIYLFHLRTFMDLYDFHTDMYMNVGATHPNIYKTHKHAQNHVNTWKFTGKTDKKVLVAAI
jgi:hypothetical protein